MGSEGVLGSPIYLIIKVTRANDLIRVITLHAAVSYGIWLSVVPRGPWHHLRLQQSGLLPLASYGAYIGHR
jgi:hypothetical protein